MPIATSWLLAVIAFFAGSLFLRRFAKFSSVAILIAGVIWFIGVLPDRPRAGVNSISSLPVWEVDDPVSTVFVLDSIPPTSGSLAAGDASVPDAYLNDPAIDTLMAILEAKGVYLHQTDAHPDGIVDSDDIVVIKGNFQWSSRKGTNTDRIKGLIWQILNHPEGFTGEVLVCDNTQKFGGGINEYRNNSEDTDQSIFDVINTFSAKGYPVYLMKWKSIWEIVVNEYSNGDYVDGYVYDADTKISYPKFKSPSGDYCISLRYGIWDSVATSYDLSRLCLIDFPVLKAHSYCGATIAVKNWIGVLTIAYYDDRYGSWNSMHYDYFFGDFALVAKVMAVTFPKFTIVDAAWTSTKSNNNSDDIWENTKMLLASTDPVAVSWYAAKYILTPIAYYPQYTDPDLSGSKYNTELVHWTTYLADSAGFSLTKDSTEISVFDRGVFGSNISPVITVMADTSVNEGDTFIRQVYATDLDDDTLTFSLTSAPEGMTIDSSSGQITFMPDFTQADVYTVTVKAEDGKSGEDAESFTLTVFNVNRAPVIVTTTIYNAMESELYSDTLVVNDPDIGDSLICEILSGPDWLSIVSIDSLGILTGTPANDDVGSDIPLSIMVQDSGGLSDTLNTTITVFANTTHFVFTANTGWSYSIVIDSIIFPELSIGDEMGVFDGELCVGAVCYDGSFTIGLAAWRDDPQTGDKDGFTDGYPMTFKFYDESAQEEFNVNVDYTEGDGNFGTGGYSQLTVFPIIIHTITLNTDWNLISSYVTPDDSSIESIAQSMGENLAIIQNDQGQFCIPDYFDGIGTWDIADAYYVYMLQIDTLEVSGSQILLSTPILLDSLWNYVPNYYTSSTPIEPALASLDTNLIIVQNDEGEFYIPGEEYNGIGNLEPGEGYSMYLSSACSLVYDSQSASPKVSTSSQVIVQYYSFAANTGRTYSILINSASIEGNSLENGDEIGVFDITVSGDTLCVGAIVFPGSYSVGLAAWIDNDRTAKQDGYIQGHTMIFKIYDASSGIEYPASAVFESGELLGDGTFGDGIYAKITVLTTTATTSVRDDRQVIMDYKLYDNYPNPFNPETIIGFQIPRESFVTLKIYNTMGQLIKTLVSDNLTSGKYDVIWDGTNELGQPVSSGMYIYHFQAGKFTAVKKMLFIR